MNKPKILVHCVVQNEGRFVWYSLMSVLSFVDKIMVWDLGSTDDTVKIIKTIKSHKITFKEMNQADPNKFTQVRQQMLDQTPKEFTWIMILDGDEIWPSNSIKKATDFARNHPDYESIVVRTHNLVGDIYHRLPESSGHYSLAGRHGHLALRFMNQKLIDGLHVNRPHGTQGFFDSTQTLIQDRNPRKIKFIDVPYHHATHLQRSSSISGDNEVPKRKQKLKFELGEKIPTNEIPEIFFATNKPPIVPSVTNKADVYFWIMSGLQTIPRRLKRLLIHNEGY